jgi:hypothetical protein
MDGTLPTTRLESNTVRMVISHKFTRATVRPLGPPQRARASRGCAHSRHVGTCPACQRAALQRAAQQLAEASLPRQVW